MRRAQQRVIASREEGAAYALRAADEAQQALQEAEEVISTKKAEVKSLVDQHCDERAVFKAKLQKEVAAQDREAAAFAETVLVQTKSCHRQQEASRHNAAMHLEKVADLHQAARGEAQERMLLHEEKSKRHVKDLEKITHQLRMRGDEALVEKMSHTTAQLVAAKTFCAEVKESLNEEIRQAKLNMAKIQEEAAANTRNEQRAVQGLEAKALDQFLASLEEASGAWHETSGKRKALQEELDELHVKFQSLHDETQARMKAIMDLWRKDREAMEEKIQVLEVKRQDAFQVVTRTMQETKDGMQAKERAARESCAEAVSQCQRQSEDTVVATYEAAAEAAKNEELVAEQVLVEAQQWKSQIKDLQAAADEEIAAIEAKAASVEIQLEKDALAQVNLSKRLAQSAAEEEKVFISETAAAWARVRKACYQLRLASLHDFARSIANGQFDSKLD
ncbi:unnamed protein product [Effrenium voratum]|nr:unnamed protein product [Effrenium voratum]